MGTNAAFNSSILVMAGNVTIGLGLKYIVCGIYTP